MVFAALKSEPITAYVEAIMVLSNPERKTLQKIAGIEVSWFGWSVRDGIYLFRSKKSPVREIVGTKLRAFHSYPDQYLILEWTWMTRLRSNLQVQLSRPQHCMLPYLRIPHLLWWTSQNDGILNSNGWRAKYGRTRFVQRHRDTLSWEEVFYSSGL